MALNDEKDLHFSAFNTKAPVWQDSGLSRTDNRTGGGRLGLQCFFILLLLLLLLLLLQTDAGQREGGVRPQMVTGDLASQPFSHVTQPDKGFTGKM